MLLPVLPPISGLLVNADGSLVGVDGTNLYSINPTTGAGTLLGSYAGQGLGTANGAANALEACTSCGP